MTAALIAVELYCITSLNSVRTKLNLINELIKAIHFNLRILARKFTFHSIDGNTGTNLSELALDRRLEARTSQSYLLATV